MGEHSGKSWGVGRRWEGSGRLGCVLTVIFGYECDSAGFS